MDPALKLAVLLLLLLGLASACSAGNGFNRCEQIVKKWAFSSLELEVREDKHTLRDLLFFLHVPRTGGRTYYHCFLRKLYASNEECPRSYDKLRYDPSKQNCRLLVTHNDYSMMSKLPKEKTSVMTILRDPVSRVFSAYEFSIEVAARFLVHPNLTSASQMAARVSARGNVVSTLDIWPWKYLVPWMREDLFARRDARKVRGSNEIKSTNPYNMEEMAMPLHQYIVDPVALDIVHNGATFQVAGLTNDSFYAESHDVRLCVQKYKNLGQHVLQVAKKRLDDMLYVGVTEEHRESATMFGNVVGAQVISQAVAWNSSMKNVADEKSEQGSLILDPEPDNNNHLQTSTSDQTTIEISSKKDQEGRKENMTVRTLMEAYEDCIHTLRRTQSKRRTNSLRRIYPANFSKADRLRVPEAVLEQIKSLNYLDLELYRYAKDIFAKQHNHITMQKMPSTEGLENMLNYSGGSITLWKTLSLAMSVILLALVVVFVNARRRTSKVKI